MSYISREIVEYSGTGRTCHLWGLGEERHTPPCSPLGLGPVDASLGETGGGARHRAREDVCTLGRSSHQDSGHSAVFPLCPAPLPRGPSPPEQTPPSVHTLLPGTQGHSTELKEKGLGLTEGNGPAEWGHWWVARLQQREGPTHPHPLTLT